MAKEKIIGIDLGTSNSEAAVMVGGKPTIIPSAEGATVAGKMFPSYVAFTADGQLLVGEPARRQAVTNPDGTVTAAKRRMGTSHIYKIYNKEYTPQQISSFILQKIKRDAEAFLGEKITKAVITVPAYFNDNQRTATKDAGKIAGLDVVRLVNEPTAASMAYGLDRGGEYKILVFDLGGGTLDVTIMEFGGGTFTVLATSGDTQLGGTDMDNAIFEWIAAEFKKMEGIDLRTDKMAVNRVKEAAEKAKIELSTVLETEINLPYVSATQAGPKHLSIKLSRSKLEQLIEPIIKRCIHPFEQALKDAGLTKDDIQKVILVGGPTRMPVVQKFIEDHVGKKMERGIDPMECVAMGAAIQGAILGGEITDMVLLDVTPLTLGLETLGGVRTSLIDRNTTIPTKKSQIFSTAADMQTSVTIHVLQGERPMAADNVSLGQFNLVGLPPAPRGVPQVEVTFDIDASGILNVSAKDLGTGKEQKMTITASTKLADSDVRKMVDDAKQYEEQDKAKKEEVEARNSADSLVYMAEKTKTDLAGKLGAEMVDQLNGAITAVKAALEGKDTSRIKAETEKLQKYRQEGPGRPTKDTRYTKEVSTRFHLTYRIDHARIAEDQQTDGVFPLITNDVELSEQQVLLVYKRQPVIEKRFSQLKTDFRVAPVYLKEVSRIQALLCVYFLVLLIESLLERELRRAMAREQLESLPLYPEDRPCRRPTARRVIDLFEDIQRHTVRGDSQDETVFVTELTDLQRHILKLLGVPATDYRA